MKPTDEHLIVMDDERDICAFVKDVAESVGYSVAAPASVGEFKTLAEDLRPVLIILDLQMPEADGVELLRHLASHRNPATIVLMSGTDRKILDTARRLGEHQGLKIAAALQKPVMVAELLPILRSHYGHSLSVTAADIDLALGQNEIELHFQPKVDLALSSGFRLSGVEVLTRWQHPANGLVMPDIFIPIAEAGGLIEDLTNYVVDTAFRQVKAWKAQGVEMPIAVNLSAQFMDDLELPERLGAFARQHDVDPNRVTLEITEGSAMGAVDRAMEVCTRLRLKGFSLSIDDFGTGYSSLSHLHRMPFSELKIDKEFVQDLSQNGESRSIVKAVVGMGKGLDLKLCAEGVEDAATVEILRELGCHYGQGHFFSPALPSEALLALVRGWSHRTDGLAGWISERFRDTGS